MKTLASYLTQTLCKWNAPILTMTIALVLAAGSSNTIAQSGAGSIEGTVADSTGAVIPGATIHIVNGATGVAADTKSNSVGFYQVPSLFAGTYVVTVSASDMKTYKTIIQLLAAQTGVVNPVMTAGAVTQQVEVSGNLMQLTDTSDGTIASTLENARINQLPMNTRLLMQLAAQTTPGLDFDGQREYANGLPTEALEFVADGVPLSNRGFGGSLNSTQGLLPDPDAVQEVHVETTASSAQYATPATGVITTKSGTNQLHGTFFETARNNAIGVARARQDPTDLVAPHLVRNEFGASAGGPIIIPKVYHGKDKSFWFFAYERYSLRQNFYKLAKVPTLAMKQGDFSGLINSSGILQQLYDPATTAASTNCNGSGAANQFCRAPFLKNQIPIGRLNKIGKIMYDISPAPTTTDNPLVANNYNFPGPYTNTIPTITFRLDHSFTEYNKAYLRYTSNNQYYTYPGGTSFTIPADGIPAAVASGGSILPNVNYGAAMGFTHVFSPTFFSETVLGQQWFQQLTGSLGDPSHHFEPELGLPNNFGEPGFPTICSTCIFGYSTNQFSYGINQIITNLDENLTKTIGKHQMQFGGRYRHERLGYQPDQRQDQVAFNNQTTGLELPSSGANYTVTPNTGYADADLFLGSVNNFSVNFLPPYQHFRSQEIDGYFQDNYHISRDLTLNLGFRLEAHPALHTKDGLIESFDLKHAAYVLPNPIAFYISKGYTTQAAVTNLQNIGVVFETSSEAGFPNANLKDFNHTISPRAGIAYQPFGSKFGTVIRSGYGRYIFVPAIRNTFQNTGSNPPFFQTYAQNISLANQSPDGKINYLVRNPQYYFAGVNTANAVNTNATDSILPGIGGSFYDPNWPPDYVTQVNVTVEQPLKGNSALRVSWLWNHGTNIDHGWYPNNHPSNFVWEMATGTVPPTGKVIGSNQYAATATGPYNQTTFGSFTYEQKNGWSNDNALQVNYQRLFHRSVAYQVSYVWSRPFRIGGNSTRDSLNYPVANYLGALGSVGSYTSPNGKMITPISPPPVPAGLTPVDQFHELIRFQNYKLDSAIPLQHISFNGIVDLPLGRGKRFLGNANRLLDELVGGFQIAGSGSILSQDFQPVSTNWGSINPIKTYKHSKKITDCRSGVCHEAYEWFNGYLAPAVINAATKGVSGLPTDYAAYSSPIDTTAGTNNVLIDLHNGSAPSTIAFAPGPSNGSQVSLVYAGNHPYSKTFVNGPMNYTVDLSLFKVFLITEKTNLRFNMDAFNAFNVQGYNNPNTTDGVQSLLSSHNTPRQVQFTLRLTF